MTKRQAKRKPKFRKGKKALAVVEIFDPIKSGAWVLIEGNDNTLTWFGYESLRPLTAREAGPRKGGKK